MYDYIIKNGLVIDGSGKEGYRADVAIRDGKIARVAENIEDEGQGIDASGLVVTPGFVDSHSHSDGAMLLWPDQIEKIEQGITLSIGGQCGGTAAPLDKNITEENAKMIGDYGKETEVYRTMGTLLEIAKDVPQGSNLMTFVGHRALRKAAMGLENRAPTETELQKMQELLEEAMVHGAIGVSFGLIYPPSCYAMTDELIALAKVVQKHGGMVAAHIRNERDQVVEAVAEFIEILRKANVRGVLSHHKAAGKNNWNKTVETLRMIDDAIEEGIDIYLDVYPYTASSTSLSVTLIPKELHASGVAGMKEYLNDPEKRREIRAWGVNKWGEDLSWILISKCAGYPEYVGKRLDEIAEIRGQDVYDAAFDIIRDSDNAVNASFFTMCEEDVKRVMKHPRAMICTDASVACGNKAYHPRLRGTFPRALGKYVREEKVAPLPEMIRKMTSLPALVYDIKNKGLVKEGYDADLCIFDPDRIIDRADYAACHERAEGLNYVLVAGEIVVENAVYNGKRKAKVILRK